LEANKKEIQSLAQEVSELEKQTKAAREAFSALKRATSDAHSSYDRRISVIPQF
jgi:predicted  nucleic acid-binding Zn-ribbon protein